jgi:hypothetical protein
VSHHQELARYGHLRTASELQQMLERLQQQLDTHASHALKAVVRGALGGRAGAGVARWHVEALRPCLAEAP